VLKRIKETGDIFFAESDRDWILDGAAVHVSMIGFDDGSTKERLLDRKPVATIQPHRDDDVLEVVTLRVVQFDRPGPRATRRQLDAERAEILVSEEVEKDVEAALVNIIKVIATTVKGSEWA
jgi:hypothetical protein